MCKKEIPSPSYILDGVLIIFFCCALKFNKVQLKIIFCPLPTEEGLNAGILKVDVSLALKTFCDNLRLFAHHCSHSYLIFPGSWANVEIIEEKDFPEKAQRFGLTNMKKIIYFIRSNNKK